MATRTVLQAEDIQRALTRIAHEIVESNKGTSNLVILGVPTRGIALAERIAAVIARIDGGGNIPTGQLDVTMYRDDLALNPARSPHPTLMPECGIEGKTVVLVDDVIYSGRTVRAALDALADHGRPKTVRFAALIDRGHRQLPVRADFVGKNLPSASSERINVRLTEYDALDEVEIVS